MKKIFYFALVVMAIFVTSCNEDSSLDPSTPIYQHYEVDFYKNYAVVMANFHEHTAEGDLVELNNGAYLRVNNMKIDYYGTGNGKDYFDYYSGNINSDIITINFKRNSNTEIINTVNRSDVSAIEIPADLIEISNDEWIDVNYAPTGFEKLTAVLFPLNGIHSGYVATTDHVTGKFTFKDVPVGNYTLRVTIRRQIPTKENDRGASGLIDIYSVDSKNVRVIEK